MNSIRWGILGTGKIAAGFARGLEVLPDAELTAVGSRTQATAEAFGEQFNIPQRYGSYAELVNDPQVDVVYVASPHSHHFEHTLLALQAGKPVLCEKAFTLTATQAALLAAEARARKLFLMEAMWTRYLPHIVELRRLLAEGAIGEPRMLNAGFCFNAPYDPLHRLFNPELGGGALLDVGIYPVALSWMIFGAPETIHSSAYLGETGVDEQAAIIFRYDQGRMALLSAGTRTVLPADPVIGGSAGMIRLHHPWWMPSALTLIRPGEPDRTWGPNHVGNGYNYQAAEVQRCLRAGLLESPLMPLDETVAIMRCLDTLRANWGVRYAADAE